LRYKLVSWVKGENGSFLFKPTQQKRPLFKIVLAVDGASIQNDCLLGLKGRNNVKPCPVYFEYKPIREKLSELLNETTLIGLCNSI
tara:strand:+ start:1684 stop:1941 length:258 start_codon:yes stop_codon:yes gene_type:complete